MSFGARRILLIGAVMICVVGVLYELQQQRADTEYVTAVARRVVRDAGAVTARERVLALRAYLRDHVTFHGAPDDARPFFRASASDTLESGLGWCGESARAFVDMAWAVGVPAQRVNFYGRAQHVVAEARIEDGEIVVVDATEPPQVADLERLDVVINRPEYEDYSTLNLRRLHLGWITRVRLEIGWLSYLAENPHAIKACLWLFALLALLGATASRSLLRTMLLRRGWVHISSLPKAPGESNERSERASTSSPGERTSVANDVMR